MRYAQQYEAANGADSRNAFAPIPTTRTCCWTPPWPRCPPTCNLAPRPSGSAARRPEGLNGVVGTQGIYSMSPANHNGLDERGVVLMQARSGAWHFLP